MAEKKKDAPQEPKRERETQADAQTDAQTDAQPLSPPPEEEQELRLTPQQAQEALAEAARQKEQYIRLLAEYDNYRKRSQKEKEQIYGDATAAAVLALLPVYDNLERATRQETSDEAYAKGVEMIMTQCREALRTLGVEEIPSLGARFDPNLHNAVMHTEDENAPENTITEVFQAGFQMGGRVIRAAMVKVAN